MCPDFSSGHVTHSVLHICSRSRSRSRSRGIYMLHVIRKLTLTSLRSRHVSTTTSATKLDPGKRLGQPPDLQVAQASHMVYWIGQGTVRGSDTQSRARIALFEFSLVRGLAASFNGFECRRMPVAQVWRLLLLFAQIQSIMDLRNLWSRSRSWSR